MGREQLRSPGVKARRTWHPGHQAERSQHPEGPEGLDVQASRFPCSVVSLSRLVVRHGFGYHAKQPAQNTRTWTQAGSEVRLCESATRCGAEREKSPDNDDDEIQQVPAAAYVGAGVHDQTVGQDFGEGLDGEDDEEDVLNLFLWTNS